MSALDRLLETPWFAPAWRVLSWLSLGSFAWQLGAWDGFSMLGACCGLVAATRLVVEHERERVR